LGEPAHHQGELRSAERLPLSLPCGRLKKRKRKGSGNGAFLFFHGYRQLSLSCSKDKQL